MKTNNSKLKNKHNSGVKRQLLAKQMKHHQQKPQKITLTKRSNHKQRAVQPLRRKRKAYLNKIIPKKPVPYYTKKKRNNLKKPSTQHSKGLNQKTEIIANKSNNNIDLALLTKLLAQQQTQVNKNQQNNQKGDSSKGNEQAMTSESNVSKIEAQNNYNVFKVNKKSVNFQNEKLQHEKHKKLNDEASKLFEALKILKSKQKGILTNLDINKLNNQYKQDSKSFSRKNTDSAAKLGSTNNKLNSKKPTQQLNKNEGSNTSANDATLTEIEKQISLLNSLNTNVNSPK